MRSSGHGVNSMQAALGLAQLERVEELVSRKREIFSWYQQELDGTEGVTLNYEAPDTKNTYWMVTAVLDENFAMTKERLTQLMSEHGIDCRPFFYPLSSLPAYCGSVSTQGARARNQVSYRISPHGVNLPSGFNLTRDRVARVCGALRAALLTPPADEVPVSQRAWENDHGQ